MPAEATTQEVRSRFSDAELCHALESNQIEWVRHKAALPWAKVQDDGDVLRVFVDPGRGWPRNLVGHARFSSESAHQRVGEIVAAHLEHKVSWLLGPLTTPADLGQHLRAHGLRCTARHVGMACELHMCPQTSPCPDKIVIQLLDEPLSLVPLNTKLRQLRHQAHLLLARTEPKQIWNFVANCNGRPVGETTLFIGAGVAGIYDVTVLEEFRRRGIGTALLVASLNHARELGLAIAILGATSMGQGMYARVGFRKICQLSFWRRGKLR